MTDILSLDTGRHMYQLNADKLFAAGSTAKLLTAATALDALGEDFRLHTLVYGSGPILSDGTLDEDIVFVASGDPNLSARIRADGTLAFQDRDHDYSGPPVPGDPLTVMRKLAEQVASRGIKRVHGDVVLDVRAFPERETNVAGRREEPWSQLWRVARAQRARRRQLGHARANPSR